MKFKEVSQLCLLLETVPTSLGPPGTKFITVHFQEGVTATEIPGVVQCLCAANLTVAYPAAVGGEGKVTPTHEAGGTQNNARQALGTNWKDLEHF